MPSVSQRKLQYIANLLRDLDRYLSRQSRDREIDELRQRIAQLFGSKIEV